MPLFDAFSFAITFIFAIFLLIIFAAAIILMLLLRYALMLRHCHYAPMPSIRFSLY